MTFLSPISLGIIGAVALASAAAIVIAYILKMRRRQFEVPFSFLWQRVLKEKETTSLFKQLRRWLSLAIQLFVVLLLALAALHPILGSLDQAENNVVLIVDASASMKTKDGPDGVSRMEQARTLASQALGSLGTNTAVMLVRMDSQTSPMGRFTRKPLSLRDKVADLRATDTPADIRSALQIATDALAGRPNPRILLIGDGAYPKDIAESIRWEKATTSPSLSEINLEGIKTQFLSVGQKSENVGIVAFNIRRYIGSKISYEVFVEVQNFGTKPAERKLTLYSGDEVVDVKTIAIAPGEKVREIYPDRGGGSDHRFRAVIESTTADQVDLFPPDDEAFALLPRVSKQRVIVISEGNLYLEGALLVYDNIELDVVPPSQYEQLLTSDLSNIDALVFDGFTPERVPTGPHLLYFSPTGEHSPFPAGRRLSGPRITDVQESHPVMRWIVMGDVNFDVVQTFKLTKNDVSLARSVRLPVIAAKQDGERRIVATGFSLTGTDMTMRIAFPLFLINVLDWFAGNTADMLTTYPTGERVALQLPSENDETVMLNTSAGDQAPLAVRDGIALFYAKQIGIHTVTSSSTPELMDVATNLANPQESNIAAPGSLTWNGKTLSAPSTIQGTGVNRTLWMIFVLLALAILIIEWATYHRRVTV